MSTGFPKMGRWLVFCSFSSMSFQHFRRNGVGIAMTMAVPLLFLLVYGYAYLLSSPEQTIKVGILPGATAATSWRDAMPAESFRVQEIDPSALDQHIKDGDPAIILDRDPESGRAIVYAAAYWEPIARLMLRSIDGLESAEDIEGRLKVAKPGATPFYMLPAIIIMALLNIGLFAGGAKLLQERSRGTLRMFRMLPVSIGWYFSAELFTKLIIAAVVTACYLVIAMLLFDVKLSAAQWAMTFVVSLANAAVFIAMGLAVASSLGRYSTGVHAFTLCNLLIVFLGDLFFSASRFALTKWIALVLPTTYGMDLLRFCMYEIPMRFPVIQSVLILAAWIVVMMIIAERNFSFKARE